jgi:hypothetical protein
MKRYVIVPDGWPCTLAACPAGSFVYQDTLCFKSEYRVCGKIEAFCKSGEFFWGGTETEEDRAALVVQPVQLVIEEVEE